MFRGINIPRGSFATLFSVPLAFGMFMGDLLLILGLDHNSSEATTFHFHGPGGSSKIIQWFLKGLAYKLPRQCSYLSSNEHGDTMRPWRQPRMYVCAPNCHIAPLLGWRRDGGMAFFADFVYRPAGPLD